jgi:6-phosphogluconolactonase/glucosamine-6-phosphate isomerase/deaminase
MGWVERMFLPLLKSGDAPTRTITHSDAESILKSCVAVLAVRAGDYMLGVSGGRTPRFMFKALAGRPVPWSRVHIFQEVNERWAPAASEDRSFPHLTDGLTDMCRRIVASDRTIQAGRVAVENVVLLAEREAEAAL